MFDYYLVAEVDVEALEEIQTIVVLTSLTCEVQVCQRTTGTCRAGGLAAEVTWPFPRLRWHFSVYTHLREPTLLGISVHKHFSFSVSVTLAWHLSVLVPTLTLTHTRNLIQAAAAAALLVLNPVKFKSIHRTHLSLLPSMPNFGL